MYASSHDRPNFHQFVLLLAVTVAIASLLAFPASAQRRSRPQRTVQARIPAASVAGGLATHDLATGGETPESLVQALVGPGAIVSNVRYTGAPVAAGTFTGGTAAVGFESGVILSSGDVARVVGPVNSSPDGADVSNGTPGDPELDAILDAQHCCTFDAAVLEFDLECPTSAAASFQYVFASEEFDPANWMLDDVFACFVNGQNVALLPGTAAPVKLLSFGCGFPASGGNCAFFVTNDCNRLGHAFPCSNLPTELDGLTVALTATGALHPGTNHVKLAIADAPDDEVDTVVFLRAQSFTCSEGDPVFEAVSHCGEIQKGWIGAPFDLDVAAWGMSSLPSASVSLDVSGDAIPLAGGTFLPPVPTSPAQPGITHFHWTPSGADAGIYHLLFTATDELQHTSSMDVAVEISMPRAPAFEHPSPCGDTLDLFVDNPFTFGVQASAWSAVSCGRTSIPGAGVTLTVAGDDPPLLGGTFVPPLPVGPAQPVATQFHWTPTLADVGTWQLQFTAADELQHASTCSVTLRVHASAGLDLCQPGFDGVTACPCGNPPANAPSGCDNSSATGGARLDSSGLASVDYSTVVFTTTGEKPTALSVLFQGKGFLPNGAIYGQGVRCVGGHLTRLFSRNAVAGSIRAPDSSEPSIPTRSEQLGDFIPSGTTRTYAVFYRDPTVVGGCPAASTFNVTQTQRILWHL
jgi:hypothetical protein